MPRSYAFLPARARRPTSATWRKNRAAMSSSWCHRTGPGITIRSPRARIIVWRKIATDGGGFTWRSKPMLRRDRRASNSREPIEALLAPERLAEIVRHLDRLDPLGVLVAELGRSAQPQRIAERIGEDLAGIFGGEDGLRMQRRRHVDALGIVVVADEIDVFRGEVGADALQEIAQVRARPLPNVIPSFDADVLDDDVLLGQLIDLLCGPRLFVVDAAGELQFPGRAVDRLDVFDVVVGVKTRRLDHF